MVFKKQAGVGDNVVAFLEPLNSLVNSVVGLTNLASDHQANGLDLHTPVMICMLIFWKGGWEGS